MSNVCVHCGEPFSGKNVFTEAGWKETRISGYCEACFDLLFAETDDPDDRAGRAESLLDAADLARDED